MVFFGPRQRTHSPESTALFMPVTLVLRTCSSHSKRSRLSRRSAETTTRARGRRRCLLPRCSKSSRHSSTSSTNYSTWIWIPGQQAFKPSSLATHTSHRRKIAMGSSSSIQEAPVRAGSSCQWPSHESQSKDPCSPTKSSSSPSNQALQLTGWPVASTGLLVEWQRMGRLAAAGHRAPPAAEHPIRWAAPIRRQT